MNVEKSGCIVTDENPFKIPFSLKTGEVAQIHDNYIVVGTNDQRVNRYWIDDQLRLDEPLKTILARPFADFDTAQEAYDAIPDPAMDLPDPAGQNQATLKPPTQIIPGPGLVGEEARLVQKPSVGRILHYWGNREQDEPWAAIIVHLWGDDGVNDNLVNVAVFHPHEGMMLQTPSVNIWDGTGIRPTHDFAEWPKHV